MSRELARLPLVLTVVAALSAGCPGPIAEVRELPPLDPADFIDVNGSVYLQFDNERLALSAVAGSGGQMRCRNGGAECLGAFPLEARIVFELIRDTANESRAQACEVVSACRTAAVVDTDGEGAFAVEGLLRGTYRITVTAVEATATVAECTPSGESFRIGQAPTTLTREMDETAAVDLDVPMECACRYFTAGEPPYACQPCASPAVSCELAP